ncbi:O-antigen polymerase [Enterococcus casseliflavus]|nr:O-antigen polymerase [Enterococcus casseliflavus]EOH84878.1 hypothetical protein UAM_00543 [Enterococcus casseliflavus ATCC 49996]EOU10617.1 hypothetical protein I582_01130 [Enterococcus casseliflavus ATCC 49996]MBE9878556.1 oligosaccharide repeat unit polymerase [Enterococcus casseliflavus]QQB84487.1 oligosaccharide repeat unit polymerase [Enterococcus casseliflavus]
MSTQFLIISCLGLGFLSYFMKRTIINPGPMFFFSWAIILYLSTLQLYGLKLASETSYHIMGIGIYSFAAGHIASFFFGGKYKFVLQKESHTKMFTWEINYKLVYLLCALTIIYNIVGTIPSLIYLIQGGSLGSIRTAIQNSDTNFTSDSIIMNFLKMFIARPFVNILPSIAICDFLIGKRNKKLLFLTTVILLMGLISTGGRNQIINLGISLVICFVIIGKQNTEKINMKKFKKKYGKFFIATFLLVLFIVYIATKSRSGDAAVRQLYYYFAMQPVMLDNWVSVVDSSNLLGWGMASFNGIFFVIFWMLHNLLFFPYPDFFNNIFTMVLNTENIWVTIGVAGVNANAYVTTFWHLYLDGRIFGVVLGMFIYGYYVTRVFSQAYFNTNLKKISLYCLMYFGTFLMFTRFPFSNIYFAVSWIMIAFFVFRKKYY